MQDVVKQLLGAIPEYLLNFFKIMAAPVRFVLDKLPQSPDETKSSLQEALKFLLISYVLIIIINAKKSNSDNFYKDLGVAAISALVIISLFAFAVYLGWKIFGSKHKFLEYFIIYSFHCGVIMIILGLFGLMSDGFMKSMDKNLYNHLMLVKEKKVTFNQDYFRNSTYQISLGIYIFGYLVGTLYSFIGWGAYRIMNSVSRSRSIAVLFVSGIFSWIAIGICFLILSGIHK